MSTVETKSVMSRIQTGNQTDRRDELILQYVPLVRVIAARIQRSLPVHSELDDLVHTGIMGLFDAASKYQDDKRASFPTYAKTRIRGAILDSFRQLDRAPRKVRKSYKLMATVTQDLIVKLHRNPSQDEIAAAMGFSVTRWRNLTLDIRDFGLGETRLRGSKHTGESISAPLCTAGYPADELFARSETRAKINSIRKMLPERDQQIITLRYDRGLKMKEIGENLGVNQSRASQIHKGALQKLKAALSLRGICRANTF